MAFQVMLILTFQMLSVIILWQQEFYKPANPTGDKDYVSNDNYAVFAASVFKYIALAFIFSKGSPYRKPFYTNCE